MTEQKLAQSEEIEGNLKRIHDLHEEATKLRNAAQAKDKEIKTLEEELENLKIDTEDQIQDLKMQLAEQSKGKVKPPSEKGSE